MKTSPIHKEILTQTVLESHVLKDLNANQFQALIGNLAAQQHLVFTSKDAPSEEGEVHNKPLHIEAIIHKKKIKRILIEGGSGLNLYTFKLLKHLGFSEDLIDPAGKITIKAYDDAERVSKGVVTFPLQVGPVTVDTPYQFIDLDLPYNILLGQPWIHNMQAIPSTCHQCLKFPYEGHEITIRGDSQPFQYCKMLEGTHTYHCILNHFAPLPKPSTDHVASTSTRTPPNIKIIEDGLGEYRFEDFLVVGRLPLSPKSYGKPT